MTERNNITSRQLAIYILTAQIGFGVLTLPSTLAQDVGHDGWISILAAGIVSSLAIVLIVLLLQKYPGKSILTINRYLFGEFLGKGLNLFLVLYLGFLTVAAFRVFTEFITLYTLDLTPTFIVAVLIAMPTVYLVWYGLKPLVQFSYFIFVVLFFIFVLALLVANKIRLTFLMPVGAAGISSLVKSTGTTFLAYIGLELVVFVYPYVADKKNTMKWALAANLTSTAFFALVFLATTGLFGENLLKSQTIPLFELSRYYRMPFIERTDLLFILLWFPLLEGTFLAYSFAAWDSLRRVFRVKNKRLFFPFFIVAAVLLSRIPSDLVEASQTTDIVNIGGITVISFLIVCYLFSFINRRGVKTR